MILTRMDIENFKQYQGVHSVDVPSQGAIGVIGENGTGKTTLFEALEWCLYSPRSLPAADVRPRDGTGQTSVLVYLESLDGHNQYIVERILKRTATATIYRVDERGDADPIVQGTRQVNDYVSAKLIGLSHTAFTATFFTRQKELHLFNDETPGKRREEVGRLLGLETIRTAQRKTVKERSQADANAKALRGQFDRESGDRDLNEELAEVDRAIAAHGAEQHKAKARLAAAIDAHASADATLKRVHQRRDRDTALRHDLATAEQRLANLERALKQAQAELTRLDRRAEERAQLVGPASQLPGLRQHVAVQEEQRSLFQRRETLEREMRDARLRQRDVVASVEGIVNGVSLHSSVKGWHWSADDKLNHGPALMRLVDIAAKADPKSAERHEQGLHHVVASHQRLETERQKLLQYRQRRTDLEAQLAQFLEDGEPGSVITSLENEREQLLKERTTIEAARTSTEAERDRAGQILANLQSQRIDGDCPTCGRPFSHHDAEIVIETMRARTVQLTNEIEQAGTQSRAITRQLEGVETRRKQVHARGDKLADIRTRIEKSAGYLENQQDAVDGANIAFKDALAVSGLTDVPAASDLADANAATNLARQLREAIPVLKSTSASLAGIAAQLERAAAEFASLADVSFDAAAFAKLRDALAQADRAEASIQMIDIELARRPSIEQELAATSNQVAESRELLARLEASRTELAYSAAELDTAQTALATTLEHERSATKQLHASETALRDAQQQRGSIEREQARLQRLEAQANASQVEADTLTLMAREFTEFERFAARRKLPILAELTSQLVESITNGRYDRVEFDEDFGIVVFDGESSDASYPVSTFSGGERDAIILAARIALSHMIGRQATAPPGFLVLDEVFGSLDANRRQHLIDALGAITRSFDELRQVFIISHVDDVRTSPVLDELWRIEESPDGGSAIVSLPAGAEIDAL